MRLGQGWCSEMEVPTLLNIYTLYCVHCILCTLYIIQIFSNPNSNAAFQRSNICDLVSLYYFSSKAILKCSIALLLRLQVLCICVEQRQSNKVGAALLKRSPLSPPLSHTKVPLPPCVPPTVLPGSPCSCCAPPYWGHALPLLLWHLQFTTTRTTSWQTDFILHIDFILTFVVQCYWLGGRSSFRRIQFSLCSLCLLCLE